MENINALSREELIARKCKLQEEKRKLYDIVHNSDYIDEFDYISRAYDNSFLSE